MPEVHLVHWLSFAALVAVLLGLDLLVFHRHDHVPRLRESFGWTVFWIALGLVFNGWIWWWSHTPEHGSELGLVWLSAYLIEKSLSMDNIFVFVVIFRYFGVPMMYQYRVLFWGILGAVFMRLAFILAGVELIHRFAWVGPLFGLLLIYTALKLTTHHGSEVHPERNVMLRVARRLLRVSQGDHHAHGHDFFVRENARLCITPMFLVLLVIESTDVVFAVDSVPAVIGVVPQSFPKPLVAFVAFTSNVFAILGLRALYFMLAGMVDLFRYLHYGLAGILGFVGVKMILQWDAVGQRLFPHAEGTHLVPTWLSLSVIAAVLCLSILVSVIANVRDARRERDAADA